MDLRLLKPRWLLIVAGMLLLTRVYQGSMVGAVPGKALAVKASPVSLDHDPANQLPAVPAPNAPAPMAPTGGRLSPVPAAAPPERGLAMGSL
ncbi:MAG TPA: hypothetical protein PLZ56_14650, partial [Anaerolineae bacterium]|nr:hypothetical protein [Anaerolineae bacterium]